MNNEECIICGAPLEYLDKPVEMECAICYRKFTNNVRCEQGHYVCDVPPAPEHQLERKNATQVVLTQ